MNAGATPVRAKAPAVRRDSKSDLAGFARAGVFEIFESQDRASAQRSDQQLVRVVTKVEYLLND